MDNIYSIKNIKFSQSRDKAFAKALKTRINNYFKEGGIKKQGGWQLYLKAFVMLSVYSTPVVLIISDVISSPMWIILMYVVIGIGMAGIGMGVMHDANHGTLSSKRIINKLFGKSLDLLGCSSEVWKLQHNVLHHTFTNIDEHDEDIDPPLILSFSPNSKKYWIHRYQHLYAWLFYGLSTIHWVFLKDFLALRKYRKMGLIRDKSTQIKEIWKTVVWKLIYLSYILILPLVFNSSAGVWIVLGFLISHFVTGLVITLIFQLAHVMPDMSFPKPDHKNEIDGNWYVHQLENTCNFSPNATLLSWFIGGLNYQIEHHLFPNISHIHYRKISKIISDTAEEYGLPYNVNENFFVAIWRHLKMLRILGRIQPAVNNN